MMGPGIGGPHMAGGWSRDGAVGEQIEASIRDELDRMQAQAGPRGESLSHCAECEEPIPEARRRAVPGVKLCVDCQSERSAPRGAGGDQPTGLEGQPAEVEGWRLRRGPRPGRGPDGGRRLGTPPPGTRTAMTLFPATPPLRSGTLPEEDGHRVFWRTFGAPSRPAILLLHGGPGGGIPARMPRLFDPARWHVVALDQRGAGRSAPHAGDDVAALRANTTRHLVRDVERLRGALGVERWHLYGSSWGATLAQAYAHAHPDRVAGMILAAVTSTSRFEIEFLYWGAGAFLPEAHEAFRAGAPEAEGGVALCAAYAERLTRGAPAEAAAAARAWCRWEEAVLQVDPRAEPTGAFAEPRFRLGFARVVTHYFRDLGWLDPPLLERAPALAGIPAVLINSRTDLSCPLATAWRLHRAMPRLELVVVPGSLHGTLYGPLAEAVVAAGRRLANGSS